MIIQQVGSQLREELLETKNELSKTKQTLTFLEQEKSETVHTTVEIEAKVQNTESKMYKLSKVGILLFIFFNIILHGNDIFFTVFQEEKRLKDTVLHLESTKAAMEHNASSFESQLSKLDEDRLKLKLELAEQRSMAETLKEELAKSEDKIIVLGQEKGSSEEKCRKEEEIREKVCKSFLLSSVRFSNWTSYGFYLRNNLHSLHCLTSYSNLIFSLNLTSRPSFLSATPWTTM